MNKILLLSTLFGLLIASASQALAISDPPIFSCTSPIGIVKSQYESGVHGVPGNYTTLTGADTVYQIDEDHVLQCLCLANSTEGIQSNWWKVVGLSSSDITYFQRRGWVYVPEGNQWGLAQAPYLVKNDAYSCGSSGGGGIGGSSANEQSGGSGNSSDTSSSSNSSTGSGGGSILGVSTLGETGTSMQLLELIGIGLLSGFLAFRLARE